VTVSFLCFPDAVTPNRLPEAPPSFAAFIFFFESAFSRGVLCGACARRFLFFFFFCVFFAKLDFLLA